MTRITEFFMQRRTLFWSLMAGIILAGVISFLYMPKLEDPAVPVKQAMVVVPYPGASAHEVELNVAQMMEDELRTLPDVHKIKTDCQPGMAMITVEFKMSVLIKDLEQHFDLLRRKVGDIASRLPSGTYAPVVLDDMMDVYGIFYSLTAPGYDYPEMYRYAKYIRRELLSVPGVKRVSIVGNRDEVINVTLPKEELARNGLIPVQIMSALQSVGKPVDAGAYRSGADDVQLRVDAPVNNEAELRDLTISTPSGKMVRLGDIARIERGLADPQRNGFFVNGEPALAICVAMETDAIVPDVGKAVDERLAEVMKTVPAGMTTDKIFFQPDKVSDAISSFMWNLLASVVIVILVLVFTMGFRSGVIIGFGLVLTIAVSFPILLQCGTTLQRISLGAFIVAMGMLVDNAVVIMDGILVDRKRGLAPGRYLYDIGKRTAMPLLGATVIAAATFIGIYLSPDSAGEYAGDLFLVLCVSLLASWVLALVQVPVCAAAWMGGSGRKKSKPGNKKASEGSDTPNASLVVQETVMNSPAHRFVRRSVGSLIRYKWLTVAASVVLLAVCMAGMLKVKNLFFPDFDYKQFVVECYFPPQTSPAHVKEQMLGMSARLRENPAVERVAMSMGAAPARYCLVRPMSSGGDNYGELIVDCDSYKTIMAQIPKILRELRKDYPDAYVRIRKYNFSISTTHTVEVEFAGPDPAVLKRLSSQAEEIMRDCPYVDPYSVQNNWYPTAKRLVAGYDHPSGVRAGVSRGDVGNALQAATDGMAIGVIPDQDKMLMVNLNVRNADGSRISDLEDIPVWSMTNMRLDDGAIAEAVSGGNPAGLADRMFRTVPLSSVTDCVRLGWEENMVRRLNGRRVIEAECDPNPMLPDATPAKVVESIRKQIDAIELPAGYSMRWVGEGELQGDAMENLLKYMPVTVFIILMILLMLFNSWKKLWLILLCLPFVFIGITPALLFTGTPFTFMAIIGLMGLMGMMVKNSIVLVDEINRQQTEEGREPYHAVVEATVSRVRPVLMASLTTIVGMMPLLGDPMYGSLALTIMGGLTAGTVITLILLPLFYTAIFHIRKLETDNEN